MFRFERARCAFENADACFPQQATSPLGLPGEAERQGMKRDSGRSQHSVGTGVQS